MNVFHVHRTVKVCQKLFRLLVLRELNSCLISIKNQMFFRHTWMNWLRLNQ